MRACQKAKFASTVVKTVTKICSNVLNTFLRVDAKGACTNGATMSAA